MPAPSLLQLARRSCIKSIKRIVDVGLARYDLIRPILLKIENPEHLHELELKSPHLLDYDGEIWMEFIKRDVPRWDEISLPKNPESWYDIYHDLLEKNAREVDEDAERMRQALLGIDSERAKHCSKVVDTRKMRLPQEKPTAIQKYASHDRKMGGLPPVFVLATKPSPRGTSAYDKGARWTFEKPKIPRQTPKKPTLPVVRRNERLCVPTHQLNNRASQVSKAPRSLVEDYKQIPVPQTSPAPSNANTTTPERPSVQNRSADRQQNSLRRDTDSKSLRQHAPLSTSMPVRSTVKPASSNSSLSGVTSTSPPATRSYTSTSVENRSSMPTKPLPGMSNTSLNLRDSKIASPQLPTKKRPAVVDASVIRPKKTRVA